MMAVQFENEAHLTEKLNVWWLNKMLKKIGEGRCSEGLIVNIRNCCLCFLCPCDVTRGAGCTHSILGCSSSPHTAVADPSPTLPPLLVPPNTLTITCRLYLQTKRSTMSVPQSKMELH